jgi:hypothetical protein
MVAIDQTWSRPFPKGAGGTESPTHKKAKQRLARWLKPGFDVVHQEYPVCRCKNGSKKYLGSLVTWVRLALRNPDNANRPHRFFTIPTFERLCRLKMPPAVIFDVACIKRGQLHSAYEVVHSNPISSEKARIIRDIQTDNRNLVVYEISAAWILSQDTKPDKLQFTTVIRGGLHEC